MYASFWWSPHRYLLFPLSWIFHHQFFTFRSIFFLWVFQFPSKYLRKSLYRLFCHQLLLNSNFVLGVWKNEGYYSYGEFLFGLIRENFHLYFGHFNLVFLIFGEYVGWEWHWWVWWGLSWRWKSLFKLWLECCFLLFTVSLLLLSFFFFLFRNHYCCYHWYMI